MTGQAAMTTQAWDTHVARTMPEKTLQERVRQMAALFGWRYYHTHRSQHSPAGFPDVVAIRGHRLLFAELKTERGRLSEPQQRWLDDLQALAEVVLIFQSAPGSSPIEVYTWRPSDLLSGAIEAVLRPAIQSQAVHDA